MNKINISDTLKNLYSNIDSLTSSRKPRKDVSEAALKNIKAASARLFGTFNADTIEQLNKKEVKLVPSFTQSELKEIESFNTKIAQLLAKPNLKQLDTSSELFDRLQHLVALGCHVAATETFFSSATLAKNAPLEKRTQQINRVIQGYSALKEILQSYIALKEIKNYRYSDVNFEDLFKKIMCRISTHIRRFFTKINNLDLTKKIRELESSLAILRDKVRNYSDKIYDVNNQLSSFRQKLLDAQNQLKTQAKKIDKEIEDKEIDKGAGVTEKITAILNKEKQEKLTDISPRESLKMIDQLIKEKQKEAAYEIPLRQWIKKLRADYRVAKNYIKNPTELTPKELIDLCLTDVAINLQKSNKECDQQYVPELLARASDFYDRYELAQSNLIPQLKEIQTSLKTIAANKAEMNTLNIKKTEFLSLLAPHEKDKKNVESELKNIQGKEAFQTNLKQLQALDEKLEVAEKKAQGITLVSFNKKV